MLEQFRWSLILPAVIAFAISALLGPLVIPWLHKLKFGQYIREEGPKAHQKKSGTPTMGGIMFLLAILAATLIMAPRYPKTLPVLLTTLGFGIIGFLDDYIKVVKKRNLGLTEIQKLVLQFLVMGAFALYLLRFSGLDSGMLIPFTGGFEDGYYLHMPTWLYLIAMVIIMLGTVNGTNLTDGLDGLLSSVTVAVAIFFAIAAAARGTGTHPAAAAVAGALMGFLLFNCHPAKVFMGDTGSLALGGFVASMAYMMQMPVFIALVGLVYLVEILSDILQVTYFKATHGKRIFKMAPIHHHFELCGWSETRVVTVFTIVTVFMCLAAWAAL